MSRLRALLANEAGGGRGHVTTLRAAAMALGPEVELVAALARGTYASELSSHCQSVIRAPLLARPVDGRSPHGLRGSATWGDVLAEIGLADEHKVRRGLAYWRGVIVDNDISLLVADVAPLALWAALGLRHEGWAIHTVNLGVGYTVPPPDLASYPAYLHDIPLSLHAEAETLDLLNRVGAEFGLEPLPQLAAVQTADLTLAASPDFLDPFRDNRALSGRIPPLVQRSRDLSGGGDEVFVYFSTTELRDERLVTALERSTLPRRGFLPSVAPAVRARLIASGMVILDNPATADEIAARSRLIVHAAPHGTISMAALAGLPQFGVPQHLEQMFNARRAASLGILAWSLPGSTDLVEQIAQAYASSRLQARARDLAHALRSDPAEGPGILAARLATILTEARAAA